MTRIIRLVSLFCLINIGYARRQRRWPRVPAVAGAVRNGGSTANCTEQWVNVTSDHFSWQPMPIDKTTGIPYASKFPLRYFTCAGSWGGAGSGAPIWFYTGNEANVEQYVNATGLMWENAMEHRALLVFAEHRFYGKTRPCASSSGGDLYNDDDGSGNDCLHLLTHEQAAADYVELVSLLKEGRAPGSGCSQGNCDDSAVIAFGGSYGGMLSAWVRMRYPATFHGAISASAPILGFPGIAGGAPNSDFPARGGWPSFYADGGASYWDIVQYDTTAAAGASDGCGSALAASFELIRDLSRTSEGRLQLMEAFGLCVDDDSVLPLTADDADGYRMQLWVLYAFDDFAMGNYPFASTYLIGADAIDPLPPFPMRAACDLLTAVSSTSPGQGGHPRGEKLRGQIENDDDGNAAALLAAVAAAANMLYNASGSELCYDSLPERDDELDGIWDYQFCTEMMCQETYFTRRGQEDGGIFPPFAFNQSAVDAHCISKYGPDVKPAREWIHRSYGGWNALVSPESTASKIVFSNGEYDPWRAAGVNDFNATDNNRDLVSVFVQEGAHHLDLMFSTEQDPKSVRDVRALELSYIAKWEAEAAATAAAGRKQGNRPDL